MSSRHRENKLAAERARRARSTAAQPAPSRRAAARSCGWCGGTINVRPVGRIPKWCSASCRQRAWEQKRAAESGLAAVRIVERVIERGADASPRRNDWPAALTELADQLDHGRIYRRDLPALATAIDHVLNAYRRAIY